MKRNDKGIIEMETNGGYTGLYYLKALACLTVVFIHFPLPGIYGKISQCIAQFSVPVFFMISGFFAYDHVERLEYCRKK